MICGYMCIVTCMNAYFTCDIDESIIVNLLTIKLLDYFVSLIKK